MAKFILGAKYKDTIAQCDFKVIGIDEKEDTLSLKALGIHPYIVSPNGIVYFSLNNQEKEINKTLILKIEN